MRTLALLFCGSCLGCSAAAAPPAPVAIPAATAPAASAAPALPPLSEREAALERELRLELDAFLALGERGFDEQGLPLAGATDHVAARLESFGYEVNRRGFQSGEQVAQNLEVVVPGLRRGNQLVIVSARIDANPGSPGADDNASGVAAALVLAQRFAGQRALRTVRFVFLSSAGPRSTTEAQGAFHYANALEQEVKASEQAAREAEEQAELEAAAGMPAATEPAPETAGPVEILAVIDLYGLGVFAPGPGSQRYPESIISSSDSGDFVALVSQPEATELAEIVGNSFRDASSLPWSHWVLLREEAWLASSPARAFADRGFPTLQLTDTRELRFEQFGGREDLATALDTSRMARAVAALEQAIEKLAGPRGKAPAPTPEGLTPSTPKAPTP